MDNDKLREFIESSKLFLKAYKNNYAPLLKPLLKEIENMVKTNPKYKSLKKYLWGDQKEKEEELKGLVDIITAEYFYSLKEWLKNPQLDKLISLQEIAEKEIEQNLNRVKEIFKYEGAGEKLKEKYDKEGKNAFEFIEKDENSKLSLQLPSPEEKKMNEAIEMYAKPFRRFWEKIKIAIDETKLDNVEKEFRNVIASNGRKMLDNIINSKFIYQLAKEKGVNYSKLLYTLKSIGFPIFQREQRRCSWYITSDSNIFFEKIYPIIKLMWDLEENYRNWIKFFKIQKGWEKSRITNFMKRRIKDRIIPAYFFNMPSNLFPPEFINKVINKNKEIIKFFEFLEKIRGIKIPTHQQLKKKLQELCSHKFKPLLT